MEIVFEWGDGWTTAALLCAFVFALVMGCRYWILRDNEKAKQRKATRHYGNAAYTYRYFSRGWFWAMWMLLLVILYVIANLITYNSSAGSTPNRPATSLEVAETFGLVSGEPRPLILGDTYSGIEGTAEAHAGLFSSRAVIDLRPSTVVTIGYEFENKWWQLKLPTDQTPFMKADGDPSATIWFKNLYMGEGEAVWEATWSECKHELRSFWNVCTRTLESEKLVVSQGLIDAGIPTFVTNYFYKAEITLNKRQHDELFPAN